MTVAFLGSLTVSHTIAQKVIQHDSEHYVLFHQYKEKWAPVKRSFPCLNLLRAKYFPPAIPGIDKDRASASGAEGYRFESCR
jgi:hypothetical protein